VTNARPDPDVLLRLVQAEEARASRGQLKVFFGATPGVGKTFAMLEAARARKLAGTEVVAGVVETHGRAETAALLDGIEVLPRRAVEYRGTVLHEFDLDGALARKPALLLVDELAHTNAPGSRHGKRWQDVEELLAAGIDVYTTVNVQHLESLNDVVAQITGVRVRETLPDAVLEGADEIELVDVTADVLLQRLHEGKVYAPELAGRAQESFFRRGNLIALRELALRRTAERVDAQMRGYMAERGIRTMWAAGDRVLVCLGDGPDPARLVRAARRIAERLGAELVALHVDVPGGSEEARARRARALSLAERLGGSAVVVTGDRPAEEIAAYARAHNVTRIVLGAPRARPWWRAWSRSLAHRLLEASPGVDVHVVAAGEAVALEAGLPLRRSAAAPRDYALAAVVPIGTALALLPLRDRMSTIDVAMLFMLGVVLVASRRSRAPSAMASVLAIALFDVLFVPPYGTFAVSDARYVLTFTVMLVVALLMGDLTGRVRRQAEAARLRERTTATLYALSRDLASARQRADLARVLLRHLHDLFGGAVALYLPDGADHVERIASLPGAVIGDAAKEHATAQWVHLHGQPAGRGTETLPAAEAHYVPLATPGLRLGAIGVRPEPLDRFDDAGQRHLLEAMVGQAAVALERTGIADEARRVHLVAEAERLRTALLSSLSHDLRTPLGAIEGAASALLADDAATPDVRRELAGTVLDEARRMHRLVANLLEMVRLESGELQVKREWHVVRDLVGVALHRTDHALAGREVSVQVPEDLPLVPVDEILLEQALVNLLENAAKHTAPGTPVEVGARSLRGAVELWVADRGPGLPPGDPARLFEKFERGGAAVSGAGLGLSIARGIVVAHGGRIWAEARPGGGATFRLTLPIVGTPPLMPEAEAALDDVAEPAPERTP
jgi:two-component system sensor histidine kinase KdpD